MLTEKEIQQLTYEYAKDLSFTDRFPDGVSESALKCYSDGAHYTTEYVAAAATETANEVSEESYENKAALIDYLNGVIGAATTMRDALEDELGLEGCQEEEPSEEDDENDWEDIINDDDDNQDEEGYEVDEED